MKKILITLTILLTLFLLVFIGFRIFSTNQDVSVGELVRNISPFGSGGGSNTNISNTPSPTDVNNPEPTDNQVTQATTNLFRLSDTPVAGSVVFTRTGQTVTRYVDRATGHIYDVTLSTQASSTSVEKVKVTNNTLPKIYEAYFRPDGSAVLLRTLANDTDVMENLSLTLTPPQSTSTDALYSVSSTPIRGRIDSVAVGQGNTLFYSLKDSRSIVSSTFTGTGLKTIYTSPFTNWRIAPAGNNLIIYTKASSNVSGYSYTLNTSTGGLGKIVGPLPGLTVTPNSSGNRIIYSYQAVGRTRLITSDSQGKTISEMSPATLAEKCVWSTRVIKNVYCGVPIDGVGIGEPDNWYRGLTHFSDRIWLFDIENETAQVLSEPKSSYGVDLDISDLKLSPNEDFLIFTNRTDLTLWALKLEE